MDSESIPRLLATRAGCVLDAIAVHAPDRIPLAFGGLAEQVAAVILSLNELGIGRNDRVAIVVPNGPEMALAFLSMPAQRPAPH